MKRPTSSPKTTSAFIGRVPTRLLAALVLLSLAATPAAAQPRWTLRAHGLWLASNADTFRSTLATGEATTQDIGDGSAVGIGLEYRIKPKFGLEFTAAFGNLESDYQIEAGGLTLRDTEDIPTEIFTLGLNYHFNSEKRADIYLGVFFAQSNFDDTTFVFGATGRTEVLRFDDDQGIGLKVGVDLPFKEGSPWAFSAELRFLSTILEGEIADQGDFDLNMLIPAIGISYRF